MPKAPPEDHRPARACLAAPYPLPYVFTRGAPDAESNAKAGPSHEPQSSVAVPSLLHSTPLITQPNPSGQISFPPVDPNWRKIQPAFPPIPYPRQDHEEIVRMRVRRLKVLKDVKDGSDSSSEWEVRSKAMSEAGEEKDESSDMLNSVQKSAMDILKDGQEDGVSQRDPVTGRNNILMYAFISAASHNTRDPSISPPSEGIRTPTQSRHMMPLISNGSGSDGEITPKARNQTLAVEEEFDDGEEEQGGPGWDVISAASSFFSEGSDAEEADQEWHDDSSASARLVTPAAIARMTRRLHRPSKGHFLGKTNQPRFTYPTPKLRHQPSQSSVGDNDISARPYHPALVGAAGGYVSESGSARTAVQIRRGRYSQMLEVGRKRRVEEPNTPTQAPRPLGHAHVTSHGQSFHRTSPQHAIPQPSMLGLEGFTYANIPAMHHPSEFLSASSPSSGERPAKRHASPRNERWSSPQPMSVDPRTAGTTADISWPHPLPPRELVPSDASTSQFVAMSQSLGEMDVPMPTASTAGHVAFGKACHNVLLSKKDAARRRKERLRRDEGKDRRLRLLMPPPALPSQTQQGYPTGYQPYFQASPWAGDDHDARFVPQMPQYQFHPQLGWVPQQQILLPYQPQNWQPVQYPAPPPHIRGNTPSYTQLSQLSIPIRSSPHEAKPARKRRRSLSPSSAYDTAPTPRRSLQAQTPTPTQALQAGYTLLPAAHISTPQMTGPNLRSPQSRPVQGTPPRGVEESGGDLWKAALQGGYESMGEENRKIARRDRWVQEERERTRAMSRGRSVKPQ
ncbi:hypothetical protein B9479_006213 [Cryptococcus floricola]|uniref:Uncharacterized protein n=1 Tax=Cryptococcus floricola TaxID=2591691 RepID=A0A5D3ASL0_9TREE|nr:hypothetical protein B9479_006213 [Cryptococcus floricola]